jgi:molybdopterin-containing oxidoreductase family membrane subunit
MEKTSERLLEEFAPQLDKPSRKWWLVFGAMFVLFVMGIYGLYYQIRYGHDVTGMRDYVVWGVYIVNFIFFMGLSYAGAIISGALHLLKTEWRKPIIRMGELITVISLLIGPCFILFCVGRFDRLHYLLIYPRIQSPITWDVIAIMTDIIGCLLYLYLSFIEDFAKLRDYAGLKVPAWKKKLYTALALNYQGTPQQVKLLKTSKNIMAAMVIAIAIIVYSVLAWIFGVTLQPGWHSTIFGPYFVIAAVYSGTGLLIILMWFYRKIFKIEAYITRQHFVNVGIMLLILGAFYGYFTFSDYLTKWYGSVRMDKLLIDHLFREYFWEFVLANYIGVIVPMVILAFRRLRTINLITFGALITLVSLWFNRYLIVVPTLETPFLPIQDDRLAWIKYTPTWVEMYIFTAGIAVFVMLMMLAAKFIPIVSISEMTEKDEPIERKSSETKAVKS